SGLGSTARNSHKHTITRARATRLASLTQPDGSARSAAILTCSSLLSGLSELTIPICYPAIGNNVAESANPLMSFTLSRPWLVFVNQGVCSDGTTIGRTSLKKTRRPAGSRPPAPPSADFRQGRPWVATYNSEIFQKSILVCFDLF